MIGTDKNALIAQAREVAAACPDSCQLLQCLADLAEAEGRRADENATLFNSVRILTAGIAAYRSGSYTLVQVWENGDGKQVPR